MSGTSPLPWFVHDFAHPAVSAPPHGPRDITVSCATPDHIGICSMENGMTATIEEARANAHLIVRAVNAHDALVEALEKCIGHVVPPKVRTQAYAALALARGEGRP